MLTSILSSMIYALPISVICAAQLFPLFCPEDAAAGPWIATAVFLAICAFFRHGSLKVRLINDNSSIKTTRTKKGFIKDLRSVSSTENKYTLT